MLNCNVQLQGQRVKTDLQETGYELVDWIYLAYDRGKWRALVKAVMNNRIA